MWPPPPLDPSDERHPAHDPRYAGFDPALLPATESLKETRLQGCSPASKRLLRRA